VILEKPLHIVLTGPTETNLSVLSVSPGNDFQKKRIFAGKTRWWLEALPHHEAGKSLRSTGAAYGREDNVPEQSSETLWSPTDKTDENPGRPKVGRAPRRSPATPPRPKAERLLPLGLQRGVRVPRETAGAGCVKSRNAFFCSRMGKVIGLEGQDEGRVPCSRAPRW
jgi:hypothetical protein